MTIVEAAPGVTGGVDTHLDVHVAAALDPLGALLGTERFATSPAGYRALLTWLEHFGAITKVGVEGTGSYGAGLARFLRRADIEVIEVDRPNRAERRRSGKSDPLDAVEAARAALGGRATSISKSRDGAVEAIRVLVVAKRSARQARVKALTQMRNLVITAPDQLRCRLTGLSVTALVTETAGLRRRARAMRCWLPTRLRSARWPIGSKGSRTKWLSSTSASLHTLRLPHPSCWPVSEWAPTRQRPSWSVRGTTLNAFTPKLPGPICAGSPRSRPHRARPPDIASTAAAIARPTARSGASSWSASPIIPRPRPTSSAR